MSESILPETDTGVVLEPGAGNPGSAAPAAPAPYADAVIRCEFCESRVTRAKGEVLEFGKRARKMRDTEVQLEDAHKKIAQLEARISELTTPAAAPAATKRGLLDRELF